MKRLFEKECFKNPVTLEVMHRSSCNNGKSVKPKELKGIKQFASIKSRDKSFQLFIDDEFNLWYKDNAVIIGYETEIIDNQVKGVLFGEKVWFKITGVYERKNQFILDTVRELSDVSEAMYVNNCVADNIALEDVYQNILTAYFNHLKEILKGEGVL